MTVRAAIMDPVDEPMLPRPFRIRRVLRETDDTFTIELAAEHEPCDFFFAAGQFNMLYVFGIGEVPISISGDPSLAGRLVHTTRAVGAVTEAMRKMKRGSVIGVRGPFGNGWPIEEAKGRDVLVVAGGIGLAPLRPVVYRLIAQRGEYGRVVVLYGTRTPSDILFQRELEQWRARFDLEVGITVDRALTAWRGNVGVVTTLIPKAPFDPRNTIAMVCGPEVMMRFTVWELQKRGLIPDRIFISMERNMKCAIGFCGHCQFGPYFVCKDGPIFRYDRVKGLLEVREI